MFVILDDSDKNAIRIIDTKDGVIDTVTYDEFCKYKRGFYRFYKKKKYAFIDDIFKYVFKAHIAGKLNTVQVHKRLYDDLSKLSDLVSDFYFPPYKFDCNPNIYICEGFYVLHLACSPVADESDYLCAITPNGIFSLDLLLDNLSFRLSSDSYNSKKFSVDCFISCDYVGTLVLDDRMHLVDHNIPLLDEKRLNKGCSI